MLKEEKMMNKIWNKKVKKANSRFDFDSINIFAKSKRSQHEIVGFILIVIIVVVIGLFLLVLYLRQEPVKYESLDVQNFLQVSMDYTTSCALNFEPEYENLQDLIKSCYENRKCLNEKMACQELNETLSKMLDESWLVSSDTPTSAYSLLIYYEESEAGESALRENELLKLEKGNCAGSKAGAEHLISYSPGNIIVNLEICYA